MSLKVNLSTLAQLRSVAFNLLVIGAGCLLIGLAVNGILLTHHFVGGGIVGLAMLVYYLAPVCSVALFSILLNIPVFVVGWRLVGHRFFFYSLAGAMILAASLKWVVVPVPVDDKILSAILAGIITGAGMGLIMRSMGSVGGVSILSVVLRHRWSVRPGTTAMAFNVLVLLGAAYTASLDEALYTFIYLFVSAKVTDVVVTGLSQRKAVFIISPQWKSISQGILQGLGRGATVIPAKGAFTGGEQTMLYTVVSMQNIGRLKELVRAVDPHAFVVLSDTLEVMGRGIGNQPLS
ncbi:MAG: YitT family protein [Desulfarculaceae bacterium]|nr:YitT family protein [Desulfarculaceae bacterium]MCF8071105.1 YitT family protein [Desulfarculaceae bacterium]MCF8100693.1 YitT family protein [Desulfarculaceae bacterium]MCF8118177.1 YitT family protein [Desulfarculaceae bacterium]